MSAKAGGHFCDRAVLHCKVSRIVCNGSPVECYRCEYACEKIQTPASKLLQQWLQTRACRAPRFGENLWLKGVM